MRKSVFTFGVAVLMLVVARPSQAGYQGGLLGTVTQGNEVVNGRTVPMFSVSFTSANYTGTPPPGCAPGANPRWAFDLTTDHGREAAATLRLARALGSYVTIYGGVGCSLGNNSEDGVTIQY